MSEPFLDYDLPPYLIAQEPLPERDQSRLLVLRRDTGTIAHHVFADLSDLLDPKDLLVLNDTRVLPARRRGHLSAGQGRGLSPARHACRVGTAARGGGRRDSLLQAARRPRRRGRHDYGARAGDRGNARETASGVVGRNKPLRLPAL